MPGVPVRRARQPEGKVLERDGFLFVDRGPNKLGGSLAFARDDFYELDLQDVAAYIPGVPVRRARQPEMRCEQDGLGGRTRRKVRFSRVDKVQLMI